MKWILVITGLLFHVSLWTQNQLAVFKPSLKDLKIEAPTNTTAYTSIPFQVVNKMIYLEAGIDQEKGVCIVDTGCPGVIINRAASANRESMQAKTLSSDLEIHSTVIKQLCLGELEVENIPGLAIPFGQFASGHKEKVLGLVGYTLFKDYETLFDFENKILHLFPYQNAALHRTASPVKQIKFSMEGHLPIITLEIGDRKLYFGLDTGAATNILDAALIKELPEEIVKYLPMEQMRCLNGEYQDVEAAVISQLAVEDYPLQAMKFLFVNLSEANKSMGQQLDGLLGYAFFTQLLCSINYHQRQLSLWEKPHSKDVF